MEVNLGEFKKVIEQKGWSVVELSAKMDLDYSYLYRILNGERHPGKKFFSGLMLLCMDEGLSFEEFVLFNKKRDGNTNSD